MSKINSTTFALCLSLFIFACGNNTPVATTSQGVSTASSGLTTDTAAKANPAVGIPLYNGSSGAVEDSTSDSADEDPNAKEGLSGGATTDTIGHKKKHKHHHHKKHNNNEDTASGQMSGSVIAPTDQASQPNIGGAGGAVPAKVYTVLKYVLAHGTPMPGYEGGRVFGNFQHLLPATDAKGGKITYHEWDVNPHLQGVNRGVERLITSSDNKAYYTNDHYKTFTQLKI